MEYNKVCVICGKPFTTYKENTVCCSKECGFINNGEISKKEERKGYNRKWIRNKTKKHKL